MAHILSAKDLGKSFGSPLFNNIQLTLQANDRLGLIGPNGSGKSTLLKILAGDLAPDHGQLNVSRNCRRVYVAQQDVFEQATLQQVLQPVIPMDAPFGLLERLATDAGFNDLNQPVAALSGGWRKRLALVRALAQDPDLLLLDEPTNHLDVEGILWLENQLATSRATLVIISHDRLFLQHTCQRMMELDRRYREGSLQIAGRYSDLVAQREEILDQQQQQQSALANTMRRELAWLRQGAKARTSKSRHRIDQAGQLQQDLSALTQRQQTKQTSEIAFAATQRQSKQLLVADQLTVHSPNGQVLVQGLDLVISPKTRLGIMGRNGCGKTTLLNTLLGHLPPIAGQLRHATGVNLVTLDQKRSQLNPSDTLQQALAPLNDQVVYQGQTIHVASWAKRFLFSVEQLGQPVAQLSGGEKARVLMAQMMLKPADILLLDEPTNDLDLPTLAILEQSLQDFAGAVILISHDRMLLDHVCEHILYLDGEHQGVFFADYPQWLHWHQAQKNQAKSTKPAQKTAQKSQSFKRRKELQRLERAIEKAEQTLAHDQQQLNDPTLAQDSEALQNHWQQLEQQQQTIDNLYDQWATLEAAD